MSASIQSQVMDAAVAALGGNDAGAWRCRFSPFKLDELKAGVDNVLPESEESDDTVLTGQTEERFRFLVRHLGAAVDEVDKAIDARYVRGAKLLLADPVLGGLVTRLRKIGRKWEFDKGEYEAVALVVTYEAEFSTNFSDPSVAGL